jgi:hypothetical protein
MDRSLRRGGQLLVAVAQSSGPWSESSSAWPWRTPRPARRSLRRDLPRPRRWLRRRRAINPPQPSRLGPGSKPMAMPPPAGSAPGRRTHPTRGRAEPTRTASESGKGTTRSRTSARRASPARTTPARATTSELSAPMRLAESALPPRRAGGRPAAAIGRRSASIRTIAPTAIRFGPGRPWLGERRRPRQAGGLLLARTGC